MFSPTSEGLFRALPGGPRVARILTGPLQGALQKVWVFKFLGLGPGGSGGPREVPNGPAWALRGPSRGLLGPPGGLRDLPQTKAKNLETEKY